MQIKNATKFTIVFIHKMSKDVKQFLFIKYKIINKNKILLIIIKIELYNVRLEIWETYKTYN